MCKIFGLSGCKGSTYFSIVQEGKRFSAKFTICSSKIHDLWCVEKQQRHSDAGMDLLSDQHHCPFVSTINILQRFLVTYIIHQKGHPVGGGFFVSLFYFLFVFRWSQACLASVSLHPSAASHPGHRPAHPGRRDLHRALRGQEIVGLVSIHPHRIWQTDSLTVRFRKGRQCFSYPYIYI